MFCQQCDSGRAELSAGSFRLTGANSTIKIWEIADKHYYNGRVETNEGLGRTASSEMGVNQKTGRYSRRSMKGRKRVAIIIWFVWLSVIGDCVSAYDNVHLIEDAGAGDREAQYTLAHLYSKGAGGVERNIMRAATWFRRAAEAGHVDSMYDLAMLLLDNEFVTAGKDESLHWLKTSAAMGHGDAQYALGRAYGSADPEQGIYWLKQAVLNGHPEAPGYLDSWCKRQSLECD